MTTKTQYDIGKEGIMEQRYTTFSLLLINISRCVQKIKNVETLANSKTHKQTISIDDEVSQNIAASYENQFV